MRNVDIDEYYSLFKGDSLHNLDKRFLALERAWKNRDFEIDKYWARATYFWAFIASAFAGYIALLSSSNLKEITEKFPQLQFIICCIGVIFSLGWVLVNIGSKKWQENWEKHIDLLEDKVTGPIYKLVIDKPSYSVSRINISVSKFILAIWLMLLCYTLYQNNSFHCKKGCSPDWITIVTALITFGFAVWMIFGSGRTNVNGEKYKFMLRDISYK